MKIKRVICIFLCLSLFLSCFLFVYNSSAFINATAIDSYSASNYNASVQPISSIDWGAGQSFTSTEHYNLTSCDFYLKRQNVASSAGYVQAFLYAHSGVFGTSSIRSGEALASSDSILGSTISNIAYGLYTFNFSSGYVLEPNVNYCIFIKAASGTWDNNWSIDVGGDTTSPTHSGNAFVTFGDAKVVQGTKDLVFAVYGASLEPTLLLPFDDQEGNSTFTSDWSGYSNNGVITGATRTFNGYHGMALSFANYNYVTVADSDSLDFNSSLAISMYVYLTSTTGNFIVKEDSFTLNYTSGYIQFTIHGEDGGSVNVAALSEWSSNNWWNSWVHITLSYEPGELLFYVNGVLKTNSSFLTSGIPVTSNDIIIGQGFTGKLDEIQLAIKTKYFEDTIASYPYGYNAYVSASAESWIVAGANYNFTTVYISQNTTYPLTYAKFNFTDGISELSLDYTVSSEAWSEFTGDEKIGFSVRTATTSDNALILYSVISINDLIATAYDVDLNLYCESATANDYYTVADLFSIYGVGGAADSVLVGDGYLVAGGSILDVAATNSSLTAGGSSAKALMFVPKFQHISFETTVYQGTTWDGSNWIEPTFEHETAWMAFGVEYLGGNGSWTNEWYLNMTIVDGAANADNAWVQLQCDWYNSASLVKTDYIYAAYEAQNESDTTTQFSLYVDLWVSDQLENCMVGGHVSAEYYGMEKTGWWLWSSWSPINGLSSESYFIDYLYNGDGEVTNVATLEMFTVWDMIAKTGVGTGYSDACVYALLSVIRTQTAPYTTVLTGINTPIFQPTTTPDQPLGFFAGIGNSFTSSINDLKLSLMSALGAFSTWGASGLDGVFSTFGITGFTIGIGEILTGIGSYFSSSVTYIVSLVTGFFQVASSIGLTIITFAGNIIDTLISIGTLTYEILAGTSSVTTGLGDIFAIFSGFGTSFYTLFIPIICLVYWWQSIDERSKKMGGGWNSIFLGDIQTLISLFSFALDMFWRVVSTMIDLGMRFLNLFM